MSLIITKIEQQKKRKNRYSLFSGEKFIIGVSGETLLEFNIHQDSELSNDQLEKVQKKENTIAAREQAWRYLARRSHSIKELHDKLVNKKFEPEIIIQILGDLKKKNYLNDEDFSRQLILDEINFKKSGPLLIQSKLIRKGVALDLITALIDELYDESEQVINCRYYANKKYKISRSEDRNTQMNKLGSYLKQKGFTWDVSKKIIMEFMAEN